MGSQFKINNMRNPARPARWFIVLGLLVVRLACGGEPVPRVEPQRPQNVLIIDGERHELPGLRAFEVGLRDVFTSRPGTVEFFVEHLDDGRFGSSASRQAFAQYLNARYMGRTIDLVLSFTEAG